MDNSALPVFELVIREWGYRHVCSWVYLNDHWIEFLLLCLIQQRFV